MEDSQNLLTLARWLAGEYENRDQAIADPVWFVNLRLWYRPLPQRLEGKLAFFAEQANVLQIQNSYRQRIAVLHEQDAQIVVQYWAFQHPEHFRGAGQDGDRLSKITLQDLEPLPGCRLTVTFTGTIFRAEPAPNAKCCFQYEGQTRQVVLGFEVSPTQFLSFDRGVDPETGRSLWGALMGPYQFRKCQDFGQELPL
jgi:hypothetical protein